MMTEGGVSSFVKKVRKYLDPQKDLKSGLPANNELIDNIEIIQLATLRSFWTDSPEIPFPEEDEVVWWEVWQRKTVNDTDKTSRILQNLKAVGVDIGVSELVFSEHRVRLVRGSARQLSQSLLLLDNLAELRKPQEITDFITHKDVSHTGRQEWLEDLINRTDILVENNSVLICLLDSGVNNQHPLITPFLPDDRLYSLKPDDWGPYDSCPNGGHGTGVAGLSIYGDLTDALASSERLSIIHGLESFKILETTNPNAPEFYGAITEEACSTPIVDRPDNPRVYCMTVADENLSFRGRPSAWSAAIDKITFGSSFDPVFPQLFILSSGNIVLHRHEEYPDKNYLNSVHDPAQAYNAISVGAYTRKDRIDQSTGYNALAEYGGMAPCNSTSLLWEPQWPLKPDIVMEGGNFSTDGTFTSDHPSLKLLTADKDYPTDIFLPFGDTSASAALVSKLAAELRATYPEFWPETIRALMIHSAEWTEAMLGRRNFNSLNERERINLLRSVGYGVPIKEKALQSANNSLTLVAERYIQPYRQEESSAKYNEYHLFKLLWPVDVLRDALFDQDVTLKVTLSYFIEPNPSSRNKRYANHFQYHSHALEFAVIKPEETPQTFQRRISASSESTDEGIDSSGEPWSIKRVRSRGSVKKDFITMSGAEMAERNILAVYPKNGWYKSRKKLGKVAASVRYSILVSLETPNTEVDLYTPVVNQIGNLIEL